MTQHTFTADDLPAQFWALVDVARRDRDRFRALAATLERDEMIQFVRDYERAAAELHAEPHLRYADPQLSEDGLDALFRWVVAQGKGFYSQVLERPELLPARVDDHDPTLGMASDVIRAFRRRYNESMKL